MKPTEEIVMNHLGKVNLLPEELAKSIKIDLTELAKEQQQKQYADIAARIAKMQPRLHK
ncbi:hypothetical protein V7138_15080 [Bacillus sp. JJ1533]|uniref:hypothetical protein n=1 Tax=Bacillus sp. JJ1533 TaxID=3122959 RepID=UPI002FFDD6C8